MLLVAGTLTVDRIFRCARLPEEGGVCRGAASLHVGGLAGIEALAAMRSGVKVALAATVGDDDDARLLRTILQRHGLASSLSVCRDASTGTSATLLDDSGRYWRIDAHAVNALFESGQAVEQMFDEARMLLCQCDGNPRTIYRLMSLARSRGIRTVLHASPPRPEVFRTLIPVADLVVTSSDSFSEILQVFDSHGLGDFGGSQLHALSDARLGALCHEIFHSDAILTMGARGAFVVERSGSFKLISAPVDSHGLIYCCAEETFAGALCARLYDGASLHQAVRYALAATSMICPTGGQDSIPRWADVLALLEGGFAGDSEL